MGGGGYEPLLTDVILQADAVFLDDEEEREECVMNELGIIYHGAYDDVSERAWNYGQVGGTRRTSHQSQK